MDIKIVFGSNLRKYRKALELSHEQLSEKLVISVSHLSNIETGKKFVSAKLLETICDKLDILPSKLFFLSDFEMIDSKNIKQLFKVIDDGVREFKDKIDEGLD